MLECLLTHGVASAFSARVSWSTSETNASTLSSVIGSRVLSEFEPTFIKFFPFISGVAIEVGSRAGESCHPDLE
jgi:hypothetical protein